MTTTAKVELTHKGLGGPYTIKINGTEIGCVEDIQLVNDGNVHKVNLTLIVDNYTLRREDDAPDEIGVMVTEKPNKFFGLFGGQKS